jgi:hypothetical protein
VAGLGQETSDLVEGRMAERGGAEGAAMGYAESEVATIAPLSATKG